MNAVGVCKMSLFGANTNNLSFLESSFRTVPVRHDTASLFLFHIYFIISIRECIHLIRIDDAFISLEIGSTVCKVAFVATIRIIFMENKIIFNLNCDDEKEWNQIKRNRLNRFSI